MARCDQLMLKEPGDRSKPIAMSMEGIVEAILANPLQITPKWRFLDRQEQWQSLVDHPQRSWLDELARRAIVAMRKPDPDRVEFLCNRILQFERPHDNHISLCTAHYLIAALEGTGGQWSQVAQRLGRLTSNPPRFQACVQNNLAYAQCRLWRPELACRTWLGNVAAYRACVPAWLSLQNLASVMLDEGAPNVPGLPSWDELQQQASAGLKQLRPAHVRAWLLPNSHFPGCESVLVFKNEKYDPPLSSHLPIDQAGEPAGKALLADAEFEIAGGNPELAAALASRAMAVCPNLVAQSQQILTQAGQLRLQKELQSEAERFYRLMKRFDQELAELTTANLDAPQATLDLMEAILPDQASIESCRARYHQQATKLCFGKAFETLEGKPSHWLRQVARYAPQAQAEVCELVAKRLDDAAEPQIAEESKCAI